MSRPRPSFLGFARNWMDWIRSRSAGSEGESAYNGVLSYAAEWHALAVAFGVGFAGTVEHSRLVTTYVLGRGGVKRQLSDDPHIRDLTDEPAYAMAGLAAGRAARHLPMVPI